MATQDVACGARLWKTGGQLRATLICKATFAVVDSGPMRIVAPAPIAIIEEFAGGDPNRACVVPSDLVPYRPRGEVLFVGHAHAPDGRPSSSLTARLAIVGHRTLVDKAIHVFGERVMLNDGQISNPVPFTRMPISHERTIYAVEDNPIGMGAVPGAPMPNLVDPQDPASPASLGPLPSQWPVRKRMLRQLDPAVIGANVAEIPDAFAWSYFQTAPADQRCAFFEGNEWLILDALHPDKSHFETQLPGARAAARAYLVPPGGTLAEATFREFPLVADTLFVDGDRGLVCLVWRGNLDFDPAQVPNVQVLAGLDMPGRTIPWPTPARAPGHADSAAEPVRPGESISPSAASVRTPHSAPPVSPAYVAPAPAGMPSAPPASPIAAAAPAIVETDTSDDGGVRTVYRQADAALVAAAARIAPMPAAPRAGETDSAVEVDPSWLERGNENEGQTRIVQSGLGVTLQVGELERLIRETKPVSGDRPPDDPAPPVEGEHPTTMRRPRFDDPETYQPDSRSIAQIVREAEAHLGSAQPPTEPPPPGAEQPPASPPLERPRPMRIPTSPTMPRVPTPSPINLNIGGGEMDRVAAMARAKAAEAAAQGAAAAREHIAAGAMRKVRPPKTTIRGLTDPNRIATPGEGAEPSRADPSTARFAASEFHDLFQESTASGAGAAAAIAATMKAAHSQPPPAPSDDDASPTTPPPAGDDAMEPLEDAPEAGQTTKISAGMTAQLAQLAASMSGSNERTAVGILVRGEPVDARAEVMRRVESGETLAGMSLEGVDLSNLNLANQNLSGARLRAAGLRGTNLDGSDLTSSTLDEADLSHASLVGANLERASLRAAILNDATVRGARVTDADFEGAIGTSSAFQSVSGERVRFVGARFDCARFEDASLPGADFSEAIVDGATFDRCDLTEARLYEVRGEAASFVGAKLGGARLDSSVLTRGRFQSIEAADSLWDQAELDQASFVGAKLAGASFTKTSCREVTFSGADLADARFNFSVLWGAQFTNVDTASVNFAGADVRGAALPTPSVPPAI